MVVAGAAMPSVALASTRSDNTTSLDQINIQQCELYGNILLDGYVGEINNKHLRANISSRVFDIMDTMKDRHIISNFKIVCDETNNTPIIIDNNKLQLDITAEMYQSAEKIQLQFRM